MSGSKDCLYFITPVYERYELTAISLRQKVDACSQLEAAGINAQCVVIGDDDNIKTAKELGLETVVRDNQYLGRKFNDGHEHAAKHGATHVAPVGSDSWMDPAWMIGSLPGTRSILVSQHYAMVHRTGRKRAQLFIPYVSYVIPVKLMEVCNYRPIAETRAKGCDTNAMATIEDSPPGGPVKHRTSKNSHELDTVAFQSGTQITDFDRIYGKWGVGQTYTPFADLRDVYPSELVDDIEEFYDVNNALTSYDLLQKAIPFVKRADPSSDLLLEIDACLVKHEREINSQS